MSKNAARFRRDNVAAIEPTKHNDQHGITKWELSPEQKTLSNLIRENDLVFVSGKAGCGKTAGVLHNYVTEYLQDKSKRIIVIRTPVEAGLDKIGALPNGVSEKIEPHFLPAKRILEELLSPGKVECDLGKRIEFMIPNFALGDTFKDALVIISEAQQLPPLILKLLLERIGIRSKCVVEGDKTQLYASEGKRNGLTHAIGVMFPDGSEECPYSDSVAQFEFSNQINQRSEIVKSVNEAYSKVGL